jgi:hypothetical protein
VSHEAKRATRGSAGRLQDPIRSTLIMHLFECTRFGSQRAASDTALRLWRLIPQSMNIEAESMRRRQGRCCLPPWAVW